VLLCTYFGTCIGLRALKVCMHGTLLWLNLVFLLQLISSGSETGRLGNIHKAFLDVKLKYVANFPFVQFEHKYEYKQLVRGWILHYWIQI
jgi:hypothetical protein